MAYTRIEYDSHARLRMRQRRVSERQVTAALTAPNRRFPSHSGRLVVERQTAIGNTLRVVYEELEGGTVAYVWTVIRRGGPRR